MSNETCVACKKWLDGRGENWIWPPGLYVRDSHLVPMYNWSHFIPSSGQDTQGVFSYIKSQ